MSTSSNDSFARKRAAIRCDILTRLNSEMWFVTMEAYLQSESLWFIVEKAEAAFLARTPWPVIPSTPADSISASSPGSIPIGFGNQAPNANNAKVWFAVFCCISDDDQRLIKPIGKSAPDVWYTLRLKYKEKLHTVNHQLQKDFIGYEKPKDKTIEEAWTELEHLGSRIVEYNPTLKRKPASGKGTQQCGQRQRGKADKFFILEDPESPSGGADLATDIRHLTRNMATVHKQDEPIHACYATLPNIASRTAPTKTGPKKA
ncbi:MAG: hypothetical protein L6R39_002311 [Caloplaca ligustica]|nr:MAG: hypothetical protein L6R39_002311 [Caloplaca ligustica]